MEKYLIKSKEQLDSLMHSLIGGSWDYIDNKYPKAYPAMFVISKSRQFYGFVYEDDFIDV